MQSFLVRKINNFTKTLSLRAKLPNTYGIRLYTVHDIEYVYDTCILLMRYRKPFAR